MVVIPDAQHPSALPSGDLTPGQSDERIHLLKQLRLGLSSTYYSMAQVLGLRRLQEYFQVTFWHASCLVMYTQPLFTQSDSVLLY